MIASDEPYDFDILKRSDGHGDLADIHPEDERREKVEIAGGGHGKERHINRVIQQEGRPGDKTPEITQPAQRQEVTAARDRVGGGEFRVRQPDHDIDEPSQGKGGRGQSLRRRDHESHGGVNVGADIGIAPGVRAPHRNIAPQIGATRLATAVPLRSDPPLIRSCCQSSSGQNGLAVEQVGHQHDRDVGVPLEGPSQGRRGAIVQEALPPMRRDELGQHDRHERVLALLVQGVDVG